MRWCVRAAFARSPNGAHAAAPSGSVWQLSPQRGLDANVIALGPGGEIREHVGPNLDVLIHVLAGAGALETETGSIELTPGRIVWLPCRSRRRFIADSEEGLRYFSVHQRKQGLTITARP
ncbi:cupin domain-containing protein [Brevibacterium oceani]|uniref:cupin domain-containing protein n=1 Tax=Brevibacterium oceani TaxID=358099 RepID=UPI0015E74EBB|nr:cupin domain-containing protein [Brevibacterium oceani]